jgi:hypothetical protein
MMAYYLPYAIIASSSLCRLCRRDLITDGRPQIVASRPAGGSSPRARRARSPPSCPSPGTRGRMLLPSTGDAGAGRAHGVRAPRRVRLSMGGHYLRRHPRLWCSGLSRRRAEPAIILNPKPVPLEPVTRSRGRGGRPRGYSSSGRSRNSAMENTGPSTQTYLGPTLQRPQMPMPHFMRFSSVV